MKAAIQTIKNHAEAIIDAINMFALDGEIEKCSAVINTSISEIRARLKYLEIRTEELRKT